VTRTNRGFTLIEATVALGIVGLTLAFVLPSVRTGLLNYRLLSTAQDIANQIQSSRYTALRNNSMSSFLLMATSKQYGVDSNADGTVNGTQEVLLAFQTGVTCTSLSTPPVSGATSISTGTKSGIGFTPRGTLASLNSSTGQPDFSVAYPSNGVVIYLLSPTNEFAAITVSPAGRIRTWRSQNGVNWQ
jgi:prepilin-type N-terminal cleavage/methylation domain-containing protein